MKNLWLALKKVVKNVSVETHFEKFKKDKGFEQARKGLNVSAVKSLKPKKYKLKKIIISETFFISNGYFPTVSSLLAVLCSTCFKV